MDSSVFELLYQDVSDAIMVIDDNAEVKYKNQLWYSFFGNENTSLGEDRLSQELQILFADGKGSSQYVFNSTNEEYLLRLTYIEGFQTPLVLAVTKTLSIKPLRNEVNESLAYASSELISPSLSIDTIARIVFKACIELTRSETGFVAFDDPMSENMLLHYFSESYIEGKDLSGNIKFIERDDYLRKGLYGTAINANSPIFKNNVNLEVDRNLVNGNLDQIRNYLSYPAIVDNVFMGQIVLVNCPGGFSEEHIKLLSSLSNVYGLAIFRKRMEWDLVSAKEKAEESDRLKTAFLANMSHEIRTPMNAIVGFSQLITSAELSGLKRDEFSTLIHASCEDLLKLVTEIIDLSKIEAKQMILYPEAFNLERVLSQQVELTKLKANGLTKNLIIDFESSQPTLSITTDQARLIQILRNLLDNALKFTDHGSIRVFYRTTENNHVEIVVKDTGIGIPYEYQKRVFESFRQLEIAMKRNYGGTGLGLSIVKNLVELMGGQISLKSDPGRGSEFMVLLPLKKYKYLNNNGETSLQSIGSIRGKQILIVEDEPRNAKFLELLMLGEKAKVKVMYNGKQAVEWVRHNHPDLILMDVRMPVMDGIEATKQIRELLPEVVIIAQTAYAMKEDELRCLDAGCNAFISKPIKRDQLLLLINDHL